MSTSTPIGPAPFTSLRALIRNSGARASDEATIRVRVERSAGGDTVVVDGASGAKTPSDRVELDMSRIDAGSQQAFAALFTRFFETHAGARAGHLRATLRGRVVPGAFGFGHLAISRPVFQATEIRPENDAVDPV